MNVRSCGERGGDSALRYRGNGTIGLNEHLEVSASSGHLARILVSKPATAAKRHRLPAAVDVKMIDGL
jgi:hypothetical protein